jgi:hypothetical protein
VFIIERIIEAMDIEYNPTVENITLSPTQEKLMVQAIEHIMSAPSSLKATTRWQFWFKQIWEAGRTEALDDCASSNNEEGYSKY